MVGIYIGGSMAQSNSNVIGYFLQHVPTFLNEEVVFIDKFRVRKAERFSSCDVIKYDGREFIDAVQDWGLYLRHAKEFLVENGIDKLIVVKLPYSNGFKRNDDNVVKNFLKSDDPRKSMSFISVRSQFETFKFIEAASSVCDFVYQYVIDPEEVTLSDYFGFKSFDKLYYLDNDCYEFAPYWSYGLMNDAGVKNEDKERDFMFYCTAEGDNRKWLRDIADDVEKKCCLDINIIRKGSKKNATKKKVISQDLYFQLLSTSKYTAVIPSYSDTTFSWMRFIEAVMCGCLPLVFKSCNLDEMRKTFPDICDIIESSLLVSDFFECEDVVNGMSENGRERIVNDIFYCDSLQNVLDIEWIRKRWQSIGGFQ